jgi:hypothetical protein
LVNVPGLGIIRALTGLDFNVENNGEGGQGDFPNPGRISSQSGLTPHYTVADAIPDLRLEVRDGKLEQRDGEQLIIKEVAEEPDDIELIVRSLSSPPENGMTTYAC